MSQHNIPLSAYHHTVSRSGQFHTVTMCCVTVTHNTQHSARTLNSSQDGPHPERCLATLTGTQSARCQINTRSTPHTLSQCVPLLGRNLTPTVPVHSCKLLPTTLSKVPLQHNPCYRWQLCLWRPSPQLPAALDSAMLPTKCTA